MCLFLFSILDLTNITIGIIVEPETSIALLNNTLSSIIENSDEMDREGVIVVIYLSELLGRTARNKIIPWLSHEYAEYLNNGFFRVIQSPATEWRQQRLAMINYNGDLNMRLSEADRQRFHAVDTAFLHLYCEHIIPTQYFIQFNDDGICERNFLKAIREFVEENHGQPWISLQFATIGATGKLFRHSELKDIARFLMFFSPTLSVDMMYQYFFNLRVQNYNYLRVPSIFRKIGNRTLPKSRSRVGRLRNNPEGALVYSSMVYVGKQVPQRAYEGSHPNHFFEGKDPRRGDEVVFVFPKPTSISRVLIQTGHRLPRDPHSTIRDILLDGKLEISARLTTEKSKFGVPQCEQYRTIGYSVMGIIDIRNIDRQYGGNVTCMRIAVLQDQVQWLAVHPISIWT